MIETFITNIPNIIIGTFIGLLFAMNSTLKLRLSACQTDYFNLRLKLPEKCVADYEHISLKERVRNLEEEIRILHLLIKHKKD